PHAQDPVRAMPQTELPPSRGRRLASRQPSDCLASPLAPLPRVIALGGIATAERLLRLKRPQKTAQVVDSEVPRVWLGVGSVEARQHRSPRGHFSLAVR